MASATVGRRTTPAGRIAATRWVFTVLGWDLRTSYMLVRDLANALERGDEIADLGLAADGNRDHILPFVSARAVAARILRG